MQAFSLSDTDALLIVDVQNDFLPGGKLAVATGDEIVPVLNRYIDVFVRHGRPVYATRDWHPDKHCSFSAQGGIWPPHCIAGSAGAEFSRDLKLPAETVVISKATSAGVDAYSGFDGTELAAQLRAAGIERIFVGGLATDYCVLNTVRDGLSSGFKVFLLVDAVRAVNLRPADGEAAIAEMIERGATPLRFSDLESGKSIFGLTGQPRSNRTE